MGTPLTDVWMIYIAAALAGILAVLCLLRRPRAVRGAATVPGLPVIGHALSLGRWGAAFLTVCRRTYGPDAFCINVGFGQRMLFVVRKAGSPQAGPQSHTTTRTPTVCVPPAPALSPSSNTHRVPPQFHPVLLEAFFRSPEEEVAFKPAVKRFTQR